MVAAIHAQETLDLPEAIERFALVAERAANARIELAVDAAAATAKSLATSAMTLGLALLIGAVAWVCLMAGGAVMLAERTGPGGALLIVGGLQGLVAAAMVLATRGALSSPEPMVGARR
jgi:hypothetical protein